MIEPCSWISSCTQHLFWLDCDITGGEVGYVEFSVVLADERIGSGIHVLSVVVSCKYFLNIDEFLIVGEIHEHRYSYTGFWSYDYARC